MSVVRRSDGLLDARGLLELVSLLGQRPTSATTAAEVLKARGLGTPTRTYNSLAVLQEMGLVALPAESGPLNLNMAPTDNPHHELRSAILNHYCQLLSSATFEGVFQFDPQVGGLVADRILLPFRDLGLPYLLVEFGIVVRATDRAWAVAEDAVPVFLDTISEANSRAIRVRPMTPAGLEAWLAARKAAGELAEAFAMTFERRRLDGHRLIDDVRWVAKEDVGMGFDLISFDDHRSLILDRFIEVKGYASERSFYWSETEIATARLKREKYWLYLIDRSRIDHQGYVPEMVSDPYAYFIEDNPAGWRSEPTSYKFTSPALNPESAPVMNGPA